jgi:hypothetical protein
MKYIVYANNETSIKYFRDSQRQKSTPTRFMFSANVNLLNGNNSKEKLVW